jgi:APA family basic amino acid/polyamine antiporter
MPQLQRQLTLFGLTMIAVGSCIGAGIFATPGSVVAVLPHAGWVVVVWMIGGLVTLTGALSFAELGGLFPKAGGIYVYLREAYGELPAFLYGWVTLLVINTGSLAALGLIFAEYLTFFIPLASTTKVFVAAGLILGLTGLNIRGINTSQWIINGFTSTKLLAMLFIVIVAVLVPESSTQTQVWELDQQLPPYWPGLLLTGLIGVLWSFGGWHHATYLAGETRHPQRNVPRAMMLGALIVTIMYVLINLAYLWLLPLGQMAGSERVAGDALAVAFTGGGRLMAILIGISVFGTVAIYTMSAPRIYFAMAQDGTFFKALARLHPRFQTPANAMLLQAIWAVLLLFFWGTFEELITYVTFIDIAFMALAGFSLFVFRRKIPGAERPYRVWGYPVIPVVYLLITLLFLTNTLLERQAEASIGLAILMLGVIVYHVFRQQRK